MQHGERREQPHLVPAQHVEHHGGGQGEQRPPDARPDAAPNRAGRLPPRRAAGDRGLRAGWAWRCSGSWLRPRRRALAGDASIGRPVSRSAPTARQCCDAPHTVLPTAQRDGMLSRTQPQPCRAPPGAARATRGRAHPSPARKEPCPCRCPVRCAPPCLLPRRGSRCSPPRLHGAGAGHDRRHPRHGHRFDRRRALAGAPVTLRNAETNAERVLTTNEQRRVRGHAAPGRHLRRDGPGARVPGGEAAQRGAPAGRDAGASPSRWRRRRCSCRRSRWRRSRRWT